MAGRVKLINGLDCSYVPNLCDVIDEVRVAASGRREWGCAHPRSAGRRGGVRVRHGASVPPSAPERFRGGDGTAYRPGNA
jgi:hypothetical protein